MQRACDRMCEAAGVCVEPEKYRELFVLITSLIFLGLLSTELVLVDGRRRVYLAGR